MKDAERDRNASGQATGALDSRRVVREHAALFNALDVQQQIAFAEDATRAKKEKRLSQGRVGELRAKLAVLHSQLIDGCIGSGVVNSTSGLRLSDSEVDDLVTEWAGPGFRGEDREEAWSELVSSPHPTPVDIQRELLRVEKAMDAENPKQRAQWWVPHIAKRRVGFQHTALTLSETADVIYYFLYAKQNPMSATFLRATALPRVLPAFGSIGRRQGLAFDPWLRVYATNGFDYVLDTDIPVEEDSNIWVLPSVQSKPSGLESRREPILFENYLMQLPPPPGPAPRAGAAAPRAAGVHLPKGFAAQLREIYPWLTDEDFTEALRPNTVAASAGESDEGDKPDGLGKVLDADRDEDAALAVMAVLEAKREEWADDTPDEHFYVTIDGGAWTEEFVGVVADQATCRGRKHTAAWCRTYGWFRAQKGFTFNLYGEEASACLAHEWQAKSHHFFSIWRVAGSSYDFKYYEADLASFVPSDIFLDLADEQDDVEGGIFRRIHELIEKHPCSVP